MQIVSQLSPFPTFSYGTTKIVVLYQVTNPPIAFTLHLVEEIQLTTADGGWISREIVEAKVKKLLTSKLPMQKRHNRVHPGHFATQQGTPFYPAGMSAADWSTIVFTLPRRKMAWVHPTIATFFQNCTLILDKYPVVSENETLPPAISPAEITLRSR